MKTCTSCGGSGYYDAGGSPSCAACSGTGNIPLIRDSDKIEILDILESEFVGLFDGETPVSGADLVDFLSDQINSRKLY